MVTKSKCVSIKFKRYAFWLWILLGLFCFRVISQLIQSKYNLPYLPTFDSWHSGAFPYHYLVISQISIILFYGYICVQFSLERIAPKRKVGLIFLSLGIIYAGIMIIRLFVGLFVSSSAWFQAYLPIFFHFILALFLLVVGLFHLKNFNFHAS